MAAGWRREYTRYRKYFLNILNFYKTRQNVRMFLELLLSLGTIAIFSLLALKPTILTIITLVQKIKAKEETIAKMEQKIQDLQVAQNVFYQQPDLISLLETAVPDSPAPERYLRQVEGVTNQNAASLLGATVEETVLIGEEVKTGKKKEEMKSLPLGAGELPVSISSLSTDYATLLSYLNQIENLRRPIYLDTTMINLVDTDIGANVVLTLSGRLPYLKNGK